MDTLPQQIIIDILSRLTNLSDIASCRLTCKTLNSLSSEISSINLLCSFDQYTQSRSQSSILPFKSNFIHFIRESDHLDSISIGVDELLQSLVYDDVEDDGDDLHLSDEQFVTLWLPFVGCRLKRLSLTDFWVQSCWRISRVLALISRYCHKLNELEIKKAWLSVDGLGVMSSLTSLTLEFVRLDDENLSKVNECFPCLQTLNLIGVGGLKEPEICLKALKTCHWTVSNVPISVTIIAPKMVKLKLKCARPKTLFLESPLLTELHLSIEKADTFNPGELPHLKKLRLESGNLHSLIDSFSCSSTVNELTVEAVNMNQLSDEAKFNLLVFNVFPILRYLILGPGFYGDKEGFTEIRVGSAGKGLI